MGKTKTKQRLKKTILYKFYCCFLKEKKENLRVRLAKKELQINGKKIVYHVSERLSRAGVTCFVNFGSLLGLIREQGFMQYDNDIDFGIYIDDLSTWKKLEYVMNKIGAKKIKQFSMNGNLTEQSYRIGHLDIDFFGYYVEGSNAYEYFYYKDDNIVYSEPNEYSAAKLCVYKISGIKKIIINGIGLYVPNESENYLASIYTEKWRIPDPNWNYKKGPSFNALKDELGKAEYFV